MNHPPHILLICTDEQAPQYMGCMGDPIARTPNLDRLASCSVLFNSAYCNNPICMPGRYSILIGRYVRELGALRYGDGLNPQTWTYPKHFAQAGYQTTCVGKQHFMGLEQMHGWMFRPYGAMSTEFGWIAYVLRPSWVRRTSQQAGMPVDTKAIANSTDRIQPNSVDIAMAPPALWQ